MRVWESLSAFPTYRMREWVQLLALYRMQVGSLQVTQLESVRESLIYHVSADTSIVKTHTYCTHTHTRIARSAATERANLPNTPHTLAKKARLVCFSFSHVSFEAALFLNLLPVLKRRRSVSWKRAVVVCGSCSSSSSPCRAASLCTCATLRRVFKPIANNRQLQLAITNMP